MRRGMRALLGSLVVLVTASWTPSAEAEPRGIVARVTLDGEGAAPTTVWLTPAEGGEVVEIAINDAGEPPDVEAGDGTYAGAEWVEGEDFTVAISFGADKRDAGSVSWAPEDEQRDLNITILGDLITTEADVSKPLPPQPDGSSSGGQPAADGGSTGQMPQEGGMPANGGGQPMALGTGTQPAGAAPASSTRLQILGLVLGALALVAVVWWWRQGGSDEPAPVAAAGAHLERLDEPPMFGGNSPALGSGVAVFGVGKADAPALIGPLLGAVARGRAVVFAAPGTVTGITSFGGPVYRSQSADPAVVGAALGKLAHGKIAGFVVVESLSSADLTAYAAALPAHTGLCVLVVDPSPELVGVRGLRRHGQRWILGEGDDRIVLRVAQHGLAVDDYAD